MTPERWLAIRRRMGYRHAPIQPFEIKGDFDHACWIDPLWKERIIFDKAGNILRGADLEEYYWQLRKGMDWHPMFGTRFKPNEQSL